MWIDYDVRNLFLTMNISSGHHFQNGRHNTAQIQYCPISTTFHMWVDMISRINSRHWKISSGRHFQNAGTIPHKFNIVRSNLDDIGQCWIFAVFWPPFWRWRSVEIFQCRESIRDIIIYPHIKFWWYRPVWEISLSVEYNHILLLLLFSVSFLSLAHEIVHGRFLEILDRISWNLVEL
jgi:hypothetical protein